MTYIADLRHVNLAQDARLRVVTGLQRLRTALRAPGGIPDRTVESGLLIATWNIREFGKSKFGYRSDEPYYYIAEILNRFDLIALQEVRSLYSLQRVTSLLGSEWDYLVTDVTFGASGNSERMAFVFDRRKVRFAGLAAEVVLPKPQNQEVLQLARSPYVAGFRAGWAQINLCTVHIYYGQSVPNDPRRVEEIKALAKLLADNAGQFRSGRAQKDDDAQGAKGENLLLLGDFNIFNRQDVTMEGLTSAGFVVPEGLGSIPGSNVEKNKHYDQIAFYKKTTGLTPTGRAGVFDFFEHVYRAADAATYQPQVPATATYSTWRTFQMSDHLPMWCEFQIDDMDAYLTSLEQEFSS
jgi:endonuclease/exonuclease/phosphatase family metal-dependent hydrolase